MIKGVYTMFYSSQAEELRAFVRDKLGFPYTDTGAGWLIFDIPEADMGVHPSGGDAKQSGVHDVSFCCDDVDSTVTELKARGVEFIDEIADVGYGRTTHFKMPGDVRLQLYQPHYSKGPAQ